MPLSIPKGLNWKQIRGQPFSARATRFYPENEIRPSNLPTVESDYTPFWHSTPEAWGQRAIHEVRRFPDREEWNIRLDPLLEQMPPTESWPEAASPPRPMYHENPFSTEPTFDFGDTEYLRRLQAWEYFMPEGLSPVWEENLGEYPVPSGDAPATEMPSSMELAEIRRKYFKGKA